MFGDELEFKLLGDFFSYGLTHEVQDVEDSGEMRYMNVALMYLWLHCYISESTVSFVKQTVDLCDSDERESEAYICNILKPIAKEIKRKIHFTDFDSMIQAMNKIEIPQWIIQHINSLTSLFAKSLLVDNYYYYVYNGGNGFKLFRIDLDKIDSLSNLDGRDSGTEIISGDIDTIFGINRHLGIIYAGIHNCQDRYVEYDIKKETIHIYHMTFEKLIDGVLPLLINKDKELYLKFGETFKFLKKIEGWESYVVSQNGIVINPVSNIPRMFKPYKICFDGTIEQDYGACKAYIKNMLNKEMCSPVERMIQEIDEQIDALSGIQKDYSDVDRFTLVWIRENYLNKDASEYEDTHHVLKMIVKLLSDYFDEDDDLLYVFYIFAEYTHKRDEVINNCLITKELFWKMQELQVTGALADCIKNEAEFSKVMLKDVYWREDTINSNGSNDTEEILLGRFEFTDEGLNFKCWGSGEAMTLGCYLVPPYDESAYKGFVAYDTRTCTTEIHYNRMLSDAEMKELEYEFDVDEDMPVKVVVE